MENLKLVMSRLGYAHQGTQSGPKETIARFDARRKTREELERDKEAVQRAIFLDFAARNGIDRERIEAKVDEHGILNVVFPTTRK